MAIAAGLHGRAEILIRVIYAADRRRITPPYSLPGAEDPIVPDAAMPQAGLPPGRPVPVRLLLVNPRFPESFWSFRWALGRILPGKRALNPPLGLATLAALCPPHWSVEIVDENVETVPLHPAADLVGVCGMGVQFPRQQELLRYYRGKGYYVVAGGSYASLCPERYTETADTVVAGEAENIWPAFCSDYACGRPRRLYKEEGIVDLRRSPVPRFDLLKLGRYATVGVQFSRGCPYRCDFCDIIVMFGRRPRTKGLEQVAAELDLLRSLGVSNLFFVDDNLIGNRPKARELLDFLARYQQRHGYRFRFGTQVSLNLAEDRDLMRLLREANFNWVFVGIESPDEASLREMNKVQNLRHDMLEAVRTVYAHGIDVLAGFIVGFDHDTAETFERQHRFIVASGIQVAMIGLLTALPRTPLYARLALEGRLVESDGSHCDNAKPRTNLVPKRMSYAEMIAGYKSLCRRLSVDRRIAQRIRNKLRYLGGPCHSGYSLGSQIRIVARLVFHGLLRAPASRLPWFLHSMMACPPRAWAQLVADWIAGLSIQDYVQRHLGDPSVTELRRARSTAESIRRRWSHCLQRGSLQVAVEDGTAGCSVMLGFKRGIDRRVFAGVAGCLRRLLRRSAVSITLRVDAMSHGECAGLARLLRQLAADGDRIAVYVDESIRHLLPIDSSVFHLVLNAPGAASD